MSTVVDLCNLPRACRERALNGKCSSYAQIEGIAVLFIFGDPFHKPTSSTFLLPSKITIEKIADETITFLKSLFLHHPLAVTSGKCRVEWHVTDGALLLFVNFSDSEPLTFRFDADRLLYQPF